MQTSSAGRQLIERNEGCVLHSYYDSVGVLTIGYGCTGRGVYVGQVITQAQADQMLSDRLAQEFEPGVERVIDGADTTQGQFDAMVSLAYNIGVGAFSGSSVARKHRAGDYEGAADAFLLWNKAGGLILSGLDRRRHEEQAMYLAGAVPKSLQAPSGGQPMGSAHQRVLRYTAPPMTGDDVKALQAALGVAPDGIFGPDTKLHVANFQAAHNLEIDGIVGPATWSALGH